MHHFIIALSAVAVVALAHMLQELRGRSRFVGVRSDDACPSPSKQNLIQPTRNPVARHSEDGSRGEAT
jgi:hypothetical protein